MNARLNLIEDIQELETRKINFKSILNDIESYYFHDGELTFTLDSNDFNKKYNGEAVKFDKNLTKAYLKAEIEQLNNKLERGIARLQTM